MDDYFLKLLFSKYLNITFVVLLIGVVIGCSSFTYASYHDAVLDEENLLEVLSSDDCSSILLTMNDFKMNMDNPVVLGFVLKIWESDPTTSRINHVLENDLSKSYLAEFLAQAYNNQLYQGEIDSLHSYAVSSLYADDQQIVANAITVLSLLSKSDFVFQEIIEVTIKAKQYIFRISVLSLIYSCSMHGQDAVEKIYVRTIRDERKKFIEEVKSEVAESKYCREDS